MSTKYHINKKGIPAVCHARPGKCPLGGINAHFETWAEALTWELNKNEEENGLLPELKEDFFVKKATTQKEKKYILDRLEKLREESFFNNNENYISRCKSSRKIQEFEKSNNKTFHFIVDRHDRVEEMSEKLGESKQLGFYLVNHIVGDDYKEQVVELFDDGKINIIDKDSKRTITTFVAHNKRTEVMLLLAGEIPSNKFLSRVKKNRNFTLNS